MQVFIFGFLRKALAFITFVAGGVLAIAGLQMAYMEITSDPKAYKATKYEAPTWRNAMPQDGGPGIRAPRIQEPTFREIYVPAEAFRPKLVLPTAFFFFGLALVVFALVLWPSKRRQWGKSARLLKLALILAVAGVIVPSAILFGQALSTPDGKVDR